MWLEAGMVIAMSGTTIAGLLLEVAPAWTAPAGAAEADRTMPPLINATAGRDAQILRIGKVIGVRLFWRDLRRLWEWRRRGSGIRGRGVVLG